MGCYFACAVDEWDSPVVHSAVQWDHVKWLASELDCALEVEDYYVRRRAAPSVMGLLLAPLVLARQELVGGAPSAMVLQW